MSWLFGSSTPWLKRNYKEKEFKVSIRYLINHLDKQDKQKMKGIDHFGRKDNWQEKKVAAVLKDLSNHRHRSIRGALHMRKEEFRIDDGISRIIAFKRKNISHINIELRVADW